jgi:hypothetical protein
VRNSIPAPFVPDDDDGRVISNVQSVFPLCEMTTSAVPGVLALMDT